MTHQQQPWLHECIITVDGPITIISEPSGDLGAPATGILADDRRVVRSSRLLLDEVACVPVANSAIGAVSEQWAAARHLDDATPDPTVDVHRRRSIDGRTVTEAITIRSRKPTALTATMTLSVDGDAADVSSIKAGQATPSALAVSGDRCGWSDDRHDVVISADPEPADVALPVTGGLDLHWPVRLGPGGAQTVVITWTIQRLAATDFDAEAGSKQVDWDPEQVAESATDPRLAELVRVGFTDLRHLTLRDPLAPDDIVAAAGTPWYLTLFGRDALWAARFMAPHSPRLVAGTLRSLARRQADSADAHTAAEPGKILHELRRTSATSHGLGLPPLYYGTVDATALWVALLRDGWRAGMPRHQVEQLVPTLDAALDWLKQAVAATPDGLVWYSDRSERGLANQGWKDSGDAMRRADGTVANSPIALLEAQAYAVDAALAAVELGRAFDHRVDEWQQWADDLSQRVRERFWVGTGDDAYLAMGLDGNGRPVDGVGSNMGHALGTGLLTTDESARVVARLLRPDMLRTFGIGTLSSDNPAYNPIGYHSGSIWTHDTAIIAMGMAREGFTNEAATVAERILRLGAASDYRLPEVCGGEAVGRHPVPYPAACRPQAWAAASASVVLEILS